MQVSVESPSKLERRVSVVVPVETYEQAFNKRILEISQTVKADGYRPGKVPLDRVRALYGEKERQNVLSDVIRNAYIEAITQEKLNPVSPPSIEPKMMVPGQPIEFVATFEIFPEIAAVKFKADKLEKQTATIEQSDVDYVIDHLKNQHVVWNQVNRAAQDKDQVVIDFRGMIDGTPFTGGEAHDYPVVLGSKTMLPGFEEGIVGMTAGQEKIIKVDFPANYFAKEVAGKTAEFTIKAHKVSQPELPEVNENFVKKLGITSGKVEDLYAEIKRNLERDCERVIKSKLKANVFDKLLEQNPIDVPSALVDQEAHRIHDEMHPHHRGQHDHGHSDEEMASFKEAAERNVKLGLLIGEFTKTNKITADKERIHSTITQIASAYEKPSEVIQWYASDKRRLAEIEMQVLEEQIVEKLLEGVNVTDKVLTYSALIGR